MGGLGVGLTDIPELDTEDEEVAGGEEEEGVEEEDLLRAGLWVRRLADAKKRETLLGLGLGCLGLGSIPCGRGDEVGEFG